MVRFAFDFLRLSKSVNGRGLSLLMPGGITGRSLLGGLFLFIFFISFLTAGHLNISSALASEPADEGLLDPENVIESARTGSAYSSSDESQEAGDNGSVLILSDTEVSDTGFFQLSWGVAGLLPGVDEDPVFIETDDWFLIERSRDPDFANSLVIYEGPDTARAESGLEDGEYYYRGRLISPSASGRGPGDNREPGEASPGNKGLESAGSGTDRQRGGEPGPVLSVRVKHHSLLYALFFFAAGALVFISTAVLIIAGHLKSKKEGTPQS